MESPNLSDYDGMGGWSTESPETGLTYWEPGLPGPRVEPSSETGRYNLMMHEYATEARRLRARRDFPSEVYRISIQEPVTIDWPEIIGKSPPPEHLAGPRLWPYVGMTTAKGLTAARLPHHRTRDGRWIPYVIAAVEAAGVEVKSEVLAYFDGSEAAIRARARELEYITSDPPQGYTCAQQNSTKWPAVPQGVWESELGLDWRALFPGHPCDQTGELA